MKKNHIALICLIAALTGCDAPTQKAAPKAPVSLVNPGQQAIELPSGEKIGLDGKLVKSFVDENKNGTYQRHVIEVPAEIMSVEGSLFYNLAKVGYQRKSKTESKEFKIYAYSKKGAPPIKASYKPLTISGASTAPLTRLVLSWKI
ncbi:hypothetical protein GIB23_17110 [Pseudomonas putida]|uniref:hypothetical protein n=1 Tax=Pseudomonas putida TaxID=303 RepID=UPI001A8DBCB1|nr:hypothetical protein [Pseudomonas putida]MBO0368804.1 hypothetical protein [Pseudomonas putida]